MNVNPESIKHQRKFHHNRPDLVGEHKYGDTGQLILLILFMIIWILDSFIFEFSTVLEKYIAWYIRLPIAAVIFISAVYLSVSGLKAVFGTVREEPEIISCGVFSLVRHPVYSGSILTYLAMTIGTLSFVTLVFWVIIVIFYYFIARYEERLLTGQFGKEYEEYRQKVPMLFPLRFR
jgi:protein-S-isoprenylcysteine O-methyltransferase Ste14